MFQVCVSLEGKLLDIVPVGGIGQSVIYPQPSILAWIISDKHGLFGKICPCCKSYFRTTYMGREVFCPYCGQRNHNLQYATPNQLEFISECCNAFIKANTVKEDIIINLNNITDGLASNKSQWVYSEEKQQNTYNCEKCRVKYDILGEYGGCPSCNRRNYLKIINNKLDKLEKRFQEADENLTNGHDREIEWENLTRCVSEFEAMANNLKDHLLRIPATPKRKSDIKNLSFQNW
ncbi:MAG: hypothetical protein MRK02_02450 [Candidatus Scalindua sp.]|nr:hypothetical protein [Candidatus Scalindua sp.]